MVASRILAPHAKLATTRWLHTATPAEDFGVADTNDDDLYAALDYLPAHQDTMPKKFAARQPSGGSLVLYCPVTVLVCEGDVGDSVTLTPEIRRLSEKFGTEQLVMVGDLGRISQKNIEQMREMEGIGRLSTPKSASIRALVEQGHLRLGLFDERNLLEMSSPEYPGQRLIACRNPELAKLRTHKREDLLATTERNLERI
jgi:hypothetical protein